MSHLAQRQYPCHKHLLLSLSQLSCNMHRQSRQCLAASEPCQVCTCTNSQCLKAAWSGQPAGFLVKQVWVAIALVSAPAASTQMAMRTCSVSMSCVVHMPYPFSKSCLLCPAVVSCTRHFWCQSGLVATQGHQPLLPVAGVLNGVTEQRQDSPCMYLAHHQLEAVNYTVGITGSYPLP